MAGSRLWLWLWHGRAAGWTPAPVLEHKRPRRDRLSPRGNPAEDQRPFRVDAEHREPIGDSRHGGEDVAFHGVLKLRADPASTGPAAVVDEVVAVPACAAAPICTSQGHTSLGGRRMVIAWVSEVTAWSRSSSPGSVRVRSEERACTDRNTQALLNAPSSQLVALAFLLAREPAAHPRRL